jgi:hypothetical protein
MVFSPRIVSLPTTRRRAEVTNLMKGLGFALPDGTLEKMAKSVDDDGAF